MIHYKIIEKLELIFIPYLLRFLFKSFLFRRLTSLKPYYIPLGMLPFKIKRPSS